MKKGLGVHCFDARYLILNRGSALGNPNKEKRSIREGSEAVLKSGVGASQR